MGIMLKIQKKGMKHKSITKPKKSDKVLLEKDKIKQLEDEIIYLNGKLKGLTPPSQRS